MPTPLDKIIDELTELTTDLYEFLLRTEGATERSGWNGQLEHYVKKTLLIRLLAGQGDRIGVHDACMQQQDYLRALVKRGVTPTAHEWDRLERWPLLLLPCLVTPVLVEAVEELIAYFKNNTCALPFSERDAQNLRTHLLTPTNPLHRSPENNIVSLPLMRPLATEQLPTSTHHDASTATTVRYLLQHELLDTVTEYLSIAEQPATTAAEHAQSLRLCAERVQLLGISAAGSDLVGLMDCCLLCHDALIRRLDTQGQLSQTGREQIKIWAGLIAAYLETPDRAEVVDALVNFYQHGKFIPAMLPCEYESLRGFLLVDSAANVTPHIEIKAVPERTPTAQIFRLSAARNSEPVTSALANRAKINEPITPTAEALAAQELEILRRLGVEISTATANLSSALSALVSDSLSKAKRITVLTDYLRILKRVENATQETGLVGIHAVIVHVSSNVRMWKTQARALTPDERDVLARWPVFVMNYLAAPGQFEVCAQIHAWLRSPLWIHDLPDYELDRIERDLHTPVVTIKQEPLAPRVQQAHREDVLIAPPQDANAKLLDTLSQELQQHAAEFSACINRIAQGHGTPLDVESAQRSAHTLKGAANTVGVTGIATLTHHIEDILSVYARQQRVPDGSAAATLLAAADVLEMMSEALLGRGNAPAHAQASLQDIIDLANRIDADGLPNTTEPALLSLPVPRAADSLSGAEKKPTAAGEKNETLLRVPASVLNDLLSLVGESIVMTGQLQERLRLSLNQSRIGAEQHLLLQQLHDELEQHVAMHHTSALETERHNELCSVTRRILEAATDARENSRQLEDHLAVFADLIPALVRVNRGSQEAVMSTRMVPVSSIAPRLQRSVRQTCRATGKHASLTVSGADTLLDSDILDELVDPLMHLLRNAIDHGIEPAASRLSAGKSETGSIKLTFARDGDHLVVSCSDDGAGLDYVRIQQVALQKGLLAANKQFSEEELSRMILLPGFTTRNESTQTSGRGIGLDAVYSSVVRMKGSLAIRSQPQGCSFEMHIPLTLMSIHALLVQSRAQVLAISSRCVEQILPVGSGQVQVDGTCLHYRVGEESYEAYEIERLLHLPLDRSWLEHGDRPVLLVRDNTGHLRAVFVENVLASQDLVVKQLGPYLPSILGIEGATILGSGGVAAVIDLPGLLQTAQSGQLAPLLAALDPAATPSAAPLALVVDDSVSARRALAEFAKDMGFEVITANDGVAALEVVKSKTPSLVLTDMEMPRLNGIELIEQLRLIPGTQPVPIIMVSSRSTKKHHELALKAGANVYMTKPFNEDELAEHIRKLTHLVTES